jgi:cytochrome c-type biogenesis protein CcmE
VSKTLISIILCALALIGLFTFEATRSSASSVLIPSELASLGDKERIRIGGRVVGEIKYSVEPKFLLDFTVNDPGKDLPALKVSYQGIKPDMFAAGRDVIIDGDYKNGVLVATKLLTQCPSKYEPPQPAQK